MNPNRRSFVQAVFPMVVGAPLAASAISTFAVRAAAQQGPQQPHQPLPPPTPENPFPEAPKIDPKVVLKHNQQQIHDDVLKLYALAGELKEQVGKTDSAIVLSLQLVQKAETIEKLAKQIKTLARGA
jgi:hypothetical protein